MKISRLIALMLCGLIASTASAEDPYPNKPINLIVPNPPGGSSDANARVMSEVMQKQLTSELFMAFRHLD